MVSSARAGPWVVCRWVRSLQGCKLPQVQPGRKRNGISTPQAVTGGGISPFSGQISEKALKTGSNEE